MADVISKGGLVKGPLAVAGSPATNTSIENAVVTGPPVTPNTESTAGYRAPIDNVDPNNPHHYQAPTDDEGFLQYMLRMGITPAQASAYLYAASYMPSQPGYNENMTHDERLNRLVNPRLYMTPEQQQQYDISNINSANQWAQHYVNKGVDPTLAENHGTTLLNNYSNAANNPYALATNTAPYNTSGTPAPWNALYNTLRAGTSSQQMTPDRTTSTGNTTTGGTATTTPKTVDVGPQNTGVDPNTGLAIHTPVVQTQNQNMNMGAPSGSQGTPTGQYRAPASYVPGLNRGDWRGATWRPVSHQPGG